MSVNFRVRKNEYQNYPETENEKKLKQKYIV